MAVKQLPGSYAPDQSKYGTPTNGSGTLMPAAVSGSSAKQSTASQAPDGSIYFTLTNGSGTLA